MPRRRSRLLENKVEQVTCAALPNRARGLGTNSKNPPESCARKRPQDPQHLALLAADNHGLRRAGNPSSWRRYRRHAETPTVLGWVVLAGVEQKPLHVPALASPKLPYRLCRRTEDSMDVGGGQGQQSPPKSRDGQPGAEPGASKVSNEARKSLVLGLAQALGTFLAACGVGICHHVFYSYLHGTVAVNQTVSRPNEGCLQSPADSLFIVVPISRERHCVRGENPVRGLDRVVLTPVVLEGHEIETVDAGDH